jgi:outer membrane protein assembly factor BamB
MHALNITTGVEQWDDLVHPGGLEMPEEGYPVAGAVAADNMVFCSTTKSYETQPAYRGHTLYAFDAATGAQVWNISGEFWASSIEVADGILIGFNFYDGREYAFGPGQTATTASATLCEGNAINIAGTVTDQTPGIAFGTPAIADPWMGQWMAYLYMEQPLPTQATGVNVVITAIDPNHNFISIGNATSDLTGYYHYTWTPPDVPGTYTIVATFNADNSYYGSSAETSTVIASPTSATPVPTATPTSVADMYFVPAIAGLFVLIIVVAIVLALLMIRKRP